MMPCFFAGVIGTLSTSPSQGQQSANKTGANVPVGGPLDSFLWPCMLTAGVRAVAGWVRLGPVACRACLPWPMAVMARAAQALGGRPRHAPATPFLHFSSPRSTNHVEWLGLPFPIPHPHWTSLARLARAWRDLAPGNFAVIFWVRCMNAPRQCGSEDTAGCL